MYFPHAFSSSVFIDFMSQILIYHIFLSCTIKNSKNKSSFLYIISFQFEKIVLIYSYNTEFERSIFMAKKFSKFLMFTALAGAAAAGAYYYLQNKNSSYSDDMDDDDDFDDFSDDLDDDTEGKDSTRNYVALNLEKAEETVKEAAEEAAEAVGEAVADAAETAKEAAKDIAETTEAKVEEFFDDSEDNSANPN